MLSLVKATSPARHMKTNSATISACCRNAKTTMRLFKKKKDLAGRRASQ